MQQYIAPNASRGVRSGDYRYDLQKRRQKKFPCPSCGQKRFVRYVDTYKDDEYLGDDVGKCDRVDRCGYHKPPREYFREHPEARDLSNSEIRHTPPPERPVEYLPLELVHLSLRPTFKVRRNNFITYLTSLFGADVAENVRLKYFIGTSRYQFKFRGYPEWVSDTGANVFWQIDIQERVHYGKVMLYDPKTGRRVKAELDADDKRALIMPVKNIVGKKDMGFQQCLFGEHLLAEYPEKRVAIVESEKTAIIASVMMPDFIWLATGGKNGAKLHTSNVVEPLKNRSVVLFPDLGAFEEWKKKANQIKEEISCTIEVSDLLERIAAPEQKRDGLDLADYLIKRDEEFGWAITEAGYPVFWDHIVEQY